MSDAQQAAVQFEVMPGWHPDPANANQVRWWDGTVWTTHVAPNPSVIPTPPAPPEVVQSQVDPLQEQLQREAAYVPFQNQWAAQPYTMQAQPCGSANTLAVWVLALTPIWASAVESLGRAVFQLVPYFGPFLGLLFGVAVIFGVAWDDHKRLLSRGYPNSPSVWWILLSPLAYLIARVAAVGRKSAPPLIVYGVLLVLFVALIVLAVVILVAQRGMY